MAQFMAIPPRAVAPTALSEVRYPNVARPHLLDTPTSQATAAIALRSRRYRSVITDGIPLEEDRTGLFRSGLESRTISSVQYF
jgi:hypothetical protein